MAKKSAAAGQIGGPADMKEWEAESDLRTLIEAEKIKADPGRMKAAMRKRGDLKKAIDAVKA